MVDELGFAFHYFFIVSDSAVFGDALSIIENLAASNSPAYFTFYPKALDFHFATHQTLGAGPESAKLYIMTIKTKSGSAIDDCESV